MIAKIVSMSSVTRIHARCHIFESFVITATMYMATSACPAKSSLVKIALKIFAVVRMIVCGFKGYISNHKPSINYCHILSTDWPISSFPSCPLYWPTVECRPSCYVAVLWSLFHLLHLAEFPYFHTFSVLNCWHQTETLTDSRVQFPFKCYLNQY